MWGGNQTFQCSTTGGPGAAVSPGQLVRLSYKRPESWNFIFSTTLLAGADSLAAQIQQVNVNFDLTIGIGRSVIILNSFESLSFVWGPLAAAPVGGQIWCSEVIAPPRAPGDTRQNICDHIVAQDIQLACRVLYQSTVANNVTLEVAAQFSPQVHLRPEWHDKRYPGGEES